MRFRRTLASGDLAMLEVELRYADGSRYLGVPVPDIPVTKTRYLIFGPMRLPQ